jgi:hypothetical protein
VTAGQGVSRAGRGMSGRQPGERQLSACAALRRGSRSLRYGGSESRHRHMPRNALPVMSKNMSFQHLQGQELLMPSSVRKDYGSKMAFRLESILDLDRHVARITRRIDKTHKAERAGVPGEVGLKITPK